MNVTIEKKIEEIKNVKEIPVIKMELTIDEAILLLVSMVDQSANDIQSKLNKYRENSGGYYINNLVNAVHMLDGDFQDISRKIFPLFNELVAEIVK